jgi:hypothetical protein
VGFNKIPILGFFVGLIRGCGEADAIISGFRFRPLDGTTVKLITGAKEDAELGFLFGL